jgi:hypothetical protein
MDAEKSYLEHNLKRFLPTPKTWLSRIRCQLLLMLGLFTASTCVTTNAGQSVTLGWDANEGQGSLISGYRLYYGTASRQYTQSNLVDISQTVSTVNNLVEGTTYYFAVTAVTSGGLESDYSEEIPYTVPSTAPAPPPALSFTEVEFENPAPVSNPGGLQADEIHIDPVGSSTNPINGRPRLDITTFGQPIMAYAVGFEAPPGKACELQVSTDLEVWRKVFYRGSQPMAERLEFFDFPGEPQGRRFYRVAVW